MEHIVATKTVVGSGDGTILCEVKGRTVRLKRRGHPDLFVPLDSAAEVARFLLAAAAAGAQAGGAGLARA